MIVVRSERCTGCGLCVKACPDGALYLLDGLATADETVCHGCGACLDVCPMSALSLIDRPEPRTASPQSLALASRSDRLPVSLPPESLSMRSRLPPLIGAALAWMGREVGPRLADCLLRMTERQSGAALLEVRNPLRGVEVRRRQHQHRYRRGCHKG